MRFRSLHKWDNLDDLKPLIFFAQLLEELLFDFSLDTYKPSATNTSLLCLEALSVIIEIEKGTIKKPNLEHVIKELSESLRRDEVAKSLISLDIEESLSEIQNKKLPIPERKVILELIYSQISIFPYKRKNEELLITAIMEQFDPNRIRNLTRSYVTTLRNFGFSPKWLYEATTTFFYYGTNRIEAREAINDYIRIFQQEERKYFAIYRASSIFKSISDSCEKLGMVVSEQLDSFSEALRESGFNLRNQDEIYVLVKDIEALDSYIAREKADSRMETVSTLLTLFHHKEHPTWAKECLILCDGGEGSRKIKKSINPMHKCIDHRPEKASKRLNRLISEFSLDDHSFPKFTRSAELHSLALNSDSLENQMINLWIALESLIPPKTNDEKANIENIIDACIPFLSLNYINRLLHRLLADLLIWKKPALHKGLRNIPGQSLKSRLVKLMVCEDFVTKRDDLIGDFRDFLLLKNRFIYLSDVVSSPNKIKKALEAHEKRVKWQLRRIYRARNTIVHLGKTPSFTPILIENIHHYLDLIMSTLVSLASGGRKISTVEQGFKFIALNYVAYSSALKKMSEEEYKNNIDIALFKYAI